MQRAAVMAPFPDARGAIATLRDGGIRTGVLTNSTTQAAEGALAAAGLRDLLDVVIGGDAVQDFKPHPRVYEHAASKLGAKGADICLIAAHAWDVMGAMRAGLRGAWVARTERWLVPVIPDPDIRGEDLEHVARQLAARATTRPAVR